MDTVTYKIFPNVTDSNTFIPFMLEIAVFMKLSVTIIADKECVNRNIRFLNLRIEIIISYRMKAGANNLKVCMMKVM
ncbi:hypothetical protein HYD59_00240 [Mycoplasmopsis bovis]|nr:hypothetical protein HYD59_00240 [Mycoplasmopsis bovis]